MFDKQQFCASHASEKRLHIMKNLHTLCAISYHGYMRVRNECSACEKICHDKQNYTILRIFLASMVSFSDAKTIFTL